MLYSLGLIFIVALILSGLTKKLGIPSLIGMLLTGIILGPYALNQIDSSILAISQDLRNIALVIIILRAGLTLNINDIKTNGNVTILLSTLPAILELSVVTVIAHIIFNMNLLSSLLLGVVVAAVSPAVVVPRMLSLIENGKKRIPQIIMASASVEDVLIIVLFTMVLNLSLLNSFKVEDIINMIVGSILSIIIGISVGYIVVKIFERFTIIESAKAISLLAISLMFISTEEILNTIYFSGLLATMFLGVTIYSNSKEFAKEISAKFKDMWVAAEIILFVIVGSSLDIVLALKDLKIALVIIVVGLTFRTIGVFLSLRVTDFSFKNKLFIAYAFFPKATVQAAIGGIALSEGIANGLTILNVSVIVILVTAPLGAFLIDKFKSKYI